MASLLLNERKERIGIFVLDTRIAVCSRESATHRVIR